MAPPPKKMGLIGSANLMFNGYKQIDRQAKYRDKPEMG